MEKMSSSSGNAKRDSMETMAVCAPVYGSEIIIPQLESVWAYVKEELFHVVDETNHQIAMDLIASLVRCVSTGVSVSSKRAILEDFLKGIVEECRDHLTRADTKNAKVAARVLGCACATDSACFYVVSIIVLSLLDECGAQPEQKKGLFLDALSEILAASIRLYSGAGADDDAMVVTNPMAPYKERLLALAASASASQDTSAQISGINHVYGLLLASDMVTTADVALLLQTLNKVVLTPSCDPDVLEAAKMALTKYSEKHPEQVLELSVSVYVTSGSNLANATSSGVSLTLTSLCIESKIFKYTVDAFISHLLADFNLPTLDLLGAIYEAKFDDELKSKKADIGLCYESVCSPLMDVALSRNVMDQAVGTIAKIVKRTYQSLDATQQHAAIVSTIDKFAKFGFTMEALSKVPVSILALTLTIT
ncbi:mms19 nucleotide excision repair [Irineochytrium annulatum]|nr:mms19 nucleotide excision repair [Irineochytrium annulatum]